MLLLRVLWRVLLMAVIVLQQGDGQYAELMRLQESRLNRWCCEMGYEMLRIYGRQRPEGSDRAGYWEKPWVIRQILRDEGLKENDILFYIEPDVLLVDLKASVLDALGAADMAMVWRTDLGATPRNHRHFCTGVQVLRVCSKVIDLYERLWELGPQDQIWVGDCRPWNQILCSQDYWPAGVTGDEAAEIVKGRWDLSIQPLGMEWNLHLTPNVPPLEQMDKAICLHWSNTPKSVVRRRMKETIQRLEKEGR
jgi:hypothetical protein